MSEIQVAQKSQIEVAAREDQSPMAMIQQALSSGTSPEVIRELVALQQSMERFNWEREERQAKIDFDAALNECQSKISLIKPQNKRENGIMWADYLTIDKEIRPIYIAAGFSISFSEVDTDDKSTMRMCATLSRGGVSREFCKNISRNPTNSKMNSVDAAAAAASRVKRYLMLDIFNIAVGIDKDEKKPFESMTDDVIDSWKSAIQGSESVTQLQSNYIGALKAAADAGDKESIKIFERVKNDTYHAIHKAVK